MDRRLAAGMMLIFLSVVLLLLAGYPDASAGEDDSRAGGNYIGSDQCISCHGSQHAGWSQTLHPDAWNPMNNSSQRSEACEHCHVTGYNEVTIGGFNATSDLPVSMRGTQCEACHGPGEEHFGSPDKTNIQKSYSAYVCGAVCHQQEHHPYYEEWNISGHSMALISLKGAGDTAVDTCLECHSTDYYLTNRSRTLETAAYAITCSRCHDPHDSTNPNQLRMPVDELCDSCHNPSGAIPGDPIYHPQSSMRDGLSGVPVTGTPYMPAVECADCHVYRYEPTNITGHSFTPKAEACVVCHQSTPPIYSNETAQVRINGWNSNTWDRILEVQELLFNAENAIEDATQLGFSASTIATAQDAFEQANYSLAFVVADGSGGVHNPVFASDLLNFSEDKSNEVMALLTPGTVIGRVVDGSGSHVEGVAVYIDGKHVATTSRNNGSFKFDYAPGTFDLDLRFAGRDVGGVESVDVVAGLVTDVGEIVVTEDSLFIYLLIVIVIIFFIAIIVIYWITRKGKTVVPEEPEEGPSREEEEESTEDSE